MNFLIKIKCMIGKHKYFAHNIAGIDCYVGAYLSCVHCRKSVELFKEYVTKNRVKRLQESYNNFNKKRINLE